MRIESIRAAKAKLNELVGTLPDEGSVVITKNGRPCAVLMPITDGAGKSFVAPMHHLTAPPNASTILDACTTSGS